MLFVYCIAIFIGNTLAPRHVSINDGHITNICTYYIHQVTNRRFITSLINEKYPFPSGARTVDGKTHLNCVWIYARARFVRYHLLQSVFRSYIFRLALANAIFRCGCTRIYIYIFRNLETHSFRSTHLLNDEHRKRSRRRARTLIDAAQRETVWPGITMRDEREKDDLLHKSVKRVKYSNIGRHTKDSRWGQAAAACARNMEGRRAISS